VGTKHFSTLIGALAALNPNQWRKSVDEFKFGKSGSDLHALAERLRAMGTMMENGEIVVTRFTTSSTVCNNDFATQTIFVEYAPKIPEGYVP